MTASTRSNTLNFNPLRRVGGDQLRALRLPTNAGFQSTPPVWAETLPMPGKLPLTNISIHSARVGGDHFIVIILSVLQISIHSARVGGDRKTRFSPANSRISIHSARVGGDSKRNHFFVS